jgi:hypothetical protein
MQFGKFAILITHLKVQFAFSFFTQVGIKIVDNIVKIIGFY